LPPSRHSRELVLTLPVVLDLGSVAPVVVHLAQHRHASASLVKRLRRLPYRREPVGRLAVSDRALLVLTIAMVLCGLWDWKIGHPAPIRWQAIIDVLLTALLLLNTLRDGAASAGQDPLAGPQPTSIPDRLQRTPR